jgi:iron(III) transport system substrate-binding protein
MIRRLALALSLVAALGAVAACGGDDEGGGDQADERTLVVYSGRAKALVGPLMADFQRRSGIKLQVRYGDSAELAATIAEEGDNSPADVFFSQDAGALGAVGHEGLLALMPKAVLDRVPTRFQDPEGRWVGTSGRARVVAYSTERLKASQLPDSIFDFTDRRWKGRIGFPPSNASFQAFISGMRLTVGDARTRAWLRDIRENDPTLLENNIQTEEAIARNEIDVGFVNHYYAYELRAEQKNFPVRNHFLRKGDPGSLVNAAGAGVLRTTDTKPDAERFVNYLLSREAQTYFADKLFEYPVAAGVAPPDGLPPLDDLQGPKIRLADLGGQLRPTLQMLDEVGLTS